MHPSKYLKIQLISESREIYHSWEQRFQFSEKFILEISKGIFLDWNLPFVLHPLGPECITLTFDQIFDDLQLSSFVSLETGETEKSNSSRMLKLSQNYCLSIYLFGLNISNLVFGKNQFILSIEQGNSMITPFLTCVLARYK